MPWNGVINSSGNAFGFQMCSERITFAIVNAQRVLVKNVRTLWNTMGNGETSDVTEH